MTKQKEDKNKVNKLVQLIKDDISFSEAMVIWLESQVIPEGGLNKTQERFYNKHLPLQQQRRDRWADRGWAMAVHEHMGEVGEG